jgi:hypothetical protein
MAPPDSLPALRIARRPVRARRPRLPMAGQADAGWRCPGRDDLSTRGFVGMMRGPLQRKGQAGIVFIAPAVAFVEAKGTSLGKARLRRVAQGAQPERGETGALTAHQSEGGGFWCATLSLPLGCHAQLAVPPP